METRLLRLSELTPAPAGTSAGWGLATLRGRLVELSGARATAVLTAAFGLVLEAQRCGEIVAWVTRPQQVFFPPDAAEGGVDLDTLVVLRLADAVSAGRAADQLLRSGGFGLVIVDLGGLGPEPDLPLALQSRLCGLAQKHVAAVVVLTERPAERPSLGSLVSLRAEAVRASVPAGKAGEAEPVCVVRTLKDKRRGGVSERREPCRAPEGFVVRQAVPQS